MENKNEKDQKQQEKKSYLTIYNEEEQKYQLVEEPPATNGYSYADYLKWKFKERLELIRGRIHKLSAPNTVHQLVSMKLGFDLYNFLGVNSCRVFIAPFDVRLPRRKNDGDEQITTVVQPDICVVCDQSKIDARGCCGAPDLVVEILSPGNTSHDVRTKFRLYEEAGVQEYWLINPEEENLVAYVLNEKGKYTLGVMFAAGDTVTSRAVPGFKIGVHTIFDFQRPGKSRQDSGN